MYNIGIFKEKTISLPVEHKDLGFKKYNEPYSTYELIPPSWYANFLT